MTQNWIKHLLISAFITFIGVTSLLTRAEEGKCAADDPGTISTCPDVGKVTFEIQWTPQNLSSNHEYQVVVKNIVLPVFDPPYGEGELNVTVWIPGLSKRQPLYSKVQHFNCSDLKKAITDVNKVFGGLFLCPFNINKTINITEWVIPIRLPLPELPVPMGSYEIRLDLMRNIDKHTGTKESLVCIHGWLIFANVTSDYTPCDDVSNARPQDLENAFNFLFAEPHVKLAHDEA